jgi:hypothetical protein
MSTITLQEVLASLHEDIQSRLSIARKSFAHPGVKGNASESVWVELLKTYLPQRYQVSAAHVVDSKGVFSDHIDVVVFDRQYSPFIFKFEGQTIVPAESVYAVFEAKQSLNAEHVAYAQGKAASVRRLHRTSLPIPHAGGTYPPKPLPAILAGTLTLESDWSPPLGEPLQAALARGDDDGRLDVGCVAAHGTFERAANNAYSFKPNRKAATAFLFELISRLQTSATVPMIDVAAYGEWLLDEA